MKKFIVPVLSMILVGTTAFTACAAETEAMVTNETPLISQQTTETTAFDGVYSIYKDGKDTNVKACLMTPLRATAEALGFTVTWNGKAAVLDNGEMHTEITVGEDEYFAVTSIEGAVGMTAPFSLGQAPYISNGTMYVPVKLFDVLCGNGSAVSENNKIDFKISTNNKENNGAEGETTQVPNPIVEYKTLEEAQKAVGFDFKAPEEVTGFENKNISVISNELIQIIYSNDNNEVCVRKAKGSDDISGDYNVYKNIKTEKINDCDVTLRGENDKIGSAVWTKGEYSYSVYADGEGLDIDTVKNIINNMD